MGEEGTRPPARRAGAAVVTAPLRDAAAATGAGTLSAATEAVLGKAGAVHEWQTFFAGQIYQENGNPLFYPAVFVWRAAPATLIGPPDAATYTPPAMRFLSRFVDSNDRELRRIQPIK